MINSFSPIAVSEIAGVDDTSEQTLSRWAKYDLMPDDKRELLIASETEGVIVGVGQKYNLVESQIEELARIVRDLFFGIISEQSLAGQILKRIPVLNEKISIDIANTFLVQIYRANPQEVIAPPVQQQGNIVQLKPKYEQMQFNQALKKYPKLNYQLVTSRPLTLKGYEGQAQPNIVNWIQDYQEKLGYEAHTTMKRTNYIFHSENCKRLSEQDRNKLMYILKAFDNKTPIEIDPKQNRLVFPRNIADIFGEEAKQQPEQPEPQAEAEEKFIMQSGQAQFRSQRSFMQPVTAQQPEQQVVDQSVSQAQTEAQPEYTPQAPVQPTQEAAYQADQLVNQAQAQAQPQAQAQVQPDYAQQSPEWQTPAQEPTYQTEQAINQAGAQPEYTQQTTAWQQPVQQPAYQPEQVVNQTAMPSQNYQQSSSDQSTVLQESGYPQPEATQSSSDFQSSSVEPSQPAVPSAIPDPAAQFSEAQPVVPPSQVSDDNQNALDNLYNKNTDEVKGQDLPEFNIEDFTVGSSKKSPNAQNISFSSGQTLPSEKADNK